MNAASYANPRVDELIDTLDTAKVTYARDALIEQIWRIVLDDIVYVPLYHVKWAWAMRDELDLPVDPYLAALPLRDMRRLLRARPEAGPPLGALTRARPLTPIKACVGESRRRDGSRVEWDAVSES